MIPSRVQLKADGSRDRKLSGNGDSFVRALAGDWRGRGFSLVVWPSRHADGPCFLEMHQTTESLFVAPVGHASAGHASDDYLSDDNLSGGNSLPDGAAEPSTLVYDRSVADMVSGMCLVREEGMWFVHPASPLERQAGQALTLIAIGSSGEVTIASGGVGVSRGPVSETAIAPVNTAPFALGAPVPEAGTRATFAPYDLGDFSQDAVRCRTPLGPAWPPPAFEGLTPQAVLDDPTSLLRATVERQVVERLMTATVGNDAALDLPASIGSAATAGDDPIFMTTFWIERVREGGVAFDQLQYLHVTNAHFAPSAAHPTFVWPQVSIATLRRVSGRGHPDFH